jgi:hypothetical protein
VPRHQLLELTQLAVAQLHSLPARCVERHDDLAQQHAAGRQRVAVGEGQDVGGSVEAAVGAVEAPQLLVPGHHDVDLGRWSVRAQHDLCHDPPQGLSRRLRPDPT